MSSYLVIKKDGAILCSFSNGEKLYKSFNSIAPHNSFEELKESQLDLGIDCLINEREDCLKSRDTYNIMIHSNLSYEDLFYVINTMKEYDEEIKEIDNTILYIKLFKRIFNESDKKLEWSIE